jgi:protein-S-isoprenylcysteine O-methyltransferase Ste14
MRHMAMKPGALFFLIIPPVAAIYILIRFAGLPWTASRILGLVVTITSLTALTVARINLGNSFSIAPRATALVTTGIYSRIRNPIYVFAAIGLAGIFLYISRPIALLYLVPLIALQTWRARHESRVLEQRFGDAYRQYRAKTWF